MIEFELNRLDGKAARNGWNRWALAAAFGSALWALLGVYEGGAEPGLGVFWWLLLSFSLDVARIVLVAFTAGEEAPRRTYLSWESRLRGTEPLHLYKISLYIIQLWCCYKFLNSGIWVSLFLCAIAFIWVLPHGLALVYLRRSNVRVSGNLWSPSALWLTSIFDAAPRVAILFGLHGANQHAFQLGNSVICSLKLGLLALVISEVVGVYVREKRNDYLEPILVELRRDLGVGRISEQEGRTRYERALLGEYLLSVVGHEVNAVMEASSEFMSKLGAFRASLERISRADSELKQGKQNPLSVEGQMLELEELYAMSKEVVERFHMVDAAREKLFGRIREIEVFSDVDRNDLDTIRERCDTCVATYKDQLTQCIQALVGMKERRKESPPPSTSVGLDDHA